MAVSTSFYGAKLEPLFLKCCSSSSTSSSYVTTHLSFFGSNKKSFVQRGSIRCDASSSDVLVDPSDNAKSVSALQQLKASAADSKSSLNVLNTRLIILVNNEWFNYMVKISGYKLKYRINFCYNNLLVNVV